MKMIVMVEIYLIITPSKCVSCYIWFVFLPFLIHVRITRTQVSDGGTYTCVASNRAGVDNKHYILQVHCEYENMRQNKTPDICTVLFYCSTV